VTSRAACRRQARSFPPRREASASGWPPPGPRSRLLLVVQLRVRRRRAAEKETPERSRRIQPSAVRLALHLIGDEGDIDRRVSRQDGHAVGGIKQQVPRADRAIVAFHLEAEVRVRMHRDARSAVQAPRIELLDLRPAAIDGLAAVEHGVLGIVSARVAAPVGIDVVPILGQLILELQAKQQRLLLGHPVTPCQATDQSFSPTVARSRPTVSGRSRVATIAHETPTIPMIIIATLSGVNAATSATPWMKMNVAALPKL